MFILFYFGTTSCWILVNIDFRPSQTMQAIGSSSLHFQFPLIFFWISHSGHPPGSKRFGPRRLLTHRCYSNAGRKIEAKHHL